MAEAETNVFESLFGKTLVTKMGADASADTTTDTASALSGLDRVGIYFSAHWCPPCRGFTPKLAETYQKLKAEHKKFEIVFASSDRDRAAAKGYHDEQPWLTLPFEEREIKDSLSKKFKVNGIPALILLDGEGNLVSTSGRGFVTSDPNGEEFPWSPPTVADCLGEKLIRAGGEEVAVSDLKGKQIALYFSAHWCPPCRAFTPELVKTYNTMKENRHDFEFIFVSSDRDQSNFDSYHGTMPWLAIPYSNRKGKQKLSELFGVRGIPSLITLQDIESGKVINKAARSACSADPSGAEFPWAPKPVNDVETGGGDLNESPCVVVLLAGHDPDKVAPIMGDLNRVGENYHKATKGEGEIKFFFEHVVGGLSRQIRKLTKQPDSGAAMILLDIPDNGGYYVADKLGDVQAFIDAYNSKKLTRQQLS